MCWYSLSVGTGLRRSISAGYWWNLRPEKTKTTSLISSTNSIWRTLWTTSVRWDHRLASLCCIILPFFLVSDNFNYAIISYTSIVDTSLQYTFALVLLLSTITKIMKNVCHLFLSSCRVNVKVLWPSFVVMKQPT